jgi:hypothetical protein
VFAAVHGDASFPETEGALRSLEPHSAEPRTKKTASRQQADKTDGRVRIL